MLEMRGDFYLAEEALGAEHRGELGVKDFDRNVAIVLFVVGEIDGCHSAPAELALDSVGGEAALNVFKGFRQTTSLSADGRKY